MMLSDHSRLFPLFNGEKELETIDRDFGHLKPPSAGFHLSRWKVIWITFTIPFRIITSIFLSVAAYFMRCLYLPLARRLELESFYLEQPIRDLSTWCQWGNNLLFPIANNYQRLISDVYTQRNLDKSSLSPLLRKNLHPKIDQIKFDLFGKLCHGSTLWFNYLMLRQLEKDESKDIPLVSTAYKVAQLFRDGQPRQAALLQALYGNEIVLVPTASGKGLFHQLPDQDGVYYFGNIDHAVSYIKKGDDHLIMDPDRGLLRMKTATEALHFFQAMSKHHSNKSFYFAKQTLTNRNVSIIAA